MPECFLWFDRFFSASHSKSISLYITYNTLLHLEPILCTLGVLGLGEGFEAQVGECAEEETDQAGEGGLGEPA